MAKDGYLQHVEKRGHPVTPGSTMYYKSLYVLTRNAIDTKLAMFEVNTYYGDTCTQSDETANHQS